MITFIIYLIGIADCAVGIFMAFGIGGFISFTIAYSVCKYDPVVEATDDTIKALRKYLILSIIVLFVGIFMPSSKTIAAMYLVPKIASNEQLTEIPNKALTILNAKLDDYINELTDNTNK